MSGLYSNGGGTGRDAEVASLSWGRDLLGAIEQWVCGPQWIDIGVSFWCLIQSYDA